MPKKILLADDSITIQKVVELTFSDGDYEVVATNNGAKAIQRLAEVRPDIILSDIIMPEKNGYEVCEYVKSHPEFRHIPVILLTGTFEPFDPDRAEKAGCDAVVTKPFESQSLIHKVEELIAQSAAPAAPAATAPGHGDPFLSDDPSLAPTYKVPALQDPQSDAAIEMPAWGAPLAAASEPEPSPFGHDAPPADAPFSEPPALESAFHDHAPSELFAGASSSHDDGAAIPLSPPPSWGAAATTAFNDEGDADDAEEAPLATDPPAAAWGGPAIADEAPADDFDATKMIPRLSLDDTGSGPAAAAPDDAELPPSHPFDDAAESGETKMLPKFGFGDLQRMREEASEGQSFETPAFDAPAAPVPPAAEHPAPSVGADEFNSGETRAIPSMSFADLPTPVAHEEEMPSPFAAPSEPEGEVVPFEAGARDESADDRAPEPMFRTSESPFEQEFEMPEGTESIPDTSSASAGVFEDEQTYEGPAVEEENAWSASPATTPPFEEHSEPLGTAAFDEAEPAVTPFEEEPSPVATSSLWSATEPESISPQPAAFDEPRTAAPLQAVPEPSATADVQTGSATLDPAAISDEVVDRIARRVVELLSDTAIRNIAWEVVPDLAEMIVRERIRQLENEA